LRQQAAHERVLQTMRRLLLEPMSNGIAAVATPVGDIDDDARRFVAATGT